MEIGAAGGKTGLFMKADICWQREARPDWDIKLARPLTTAFSVDLSSSSLRCSFSRRSAVLTISLSSSRVSPIGAGAAAIGGEGPARMEGWAYARRSCRCWRRMGRVTCRPAKPSMDHHASHAYLLSNSRSEVKFGSWVISRA